MGHELGGVSSTSSTGRSGVRGTVAPVGGVVRAGADLDGLLGAMPRWRVVLQHPEAAARTVAAIW